MTTRAAAYAHHAPDAPGRALAGAQRYRLGNIHVDRAEMLRYLGYTGQKIDEDLARRIERVAREVEQTLEPHGVSQVFGVDTHARTAAGASCVRLVGTVVELTGDDIHRHLEGACAVALLAVTLGMESERRLRTLAATEPVEAALFDAAASAYVEAAADAVDAAIATDATRTGFVRNGRFSCGYGDCPLTAQGPIIDALDARRALGITVTESYLLVPSKSITALIGLFERGNGVQDASRTCAHCALKESCAFRARGERCWRRANSVQED